MNEQMMQNKRDQYINRIDSVYDELEAHTEKFLEEHKEIRLRLARLMEEARLESDLGATDIARHRGISRQAIHKLTKEAFGIRHADKAEAARKGHEYKANNSQESLVES